MFRALVVLTLVTVVQSGSIVEGINRLASSLYSSLAQDDSNLFFSPYSVSIALHTLATGSRGTTLDQIYATLGVGHMGAVDIGKDLDDLQSQLSSHGLQSYNQLFVNQLFTLLPSFESVSKVDFTQAGPARETINTWVSDKTDGKIKELLDHGAISAATKLVIINIVNFKGVWREKFKKRNTRLALFYLSPDTFVNIKMMQQKTDYKYVENSVYQAAALPFEGTDIEMIVIKPKTNLKSFEQTLRQQDGFIDFTKIYESMQYNHVDIKIPLIEISLKYNLNKVLQSHGITDVFNPSLADLSDFTHTDSSGLCLSDTIHQTHLRIDEDGCEASAATAMSILLTSGNISKSKMLYLDQPFVVVLRARGSGLVLFVGRILEFEGERREVEELNHTEL